MLLLGVLDWRLAASVACCNEKNKRDGVLNLYVSYFCTDCIVMSWLPVAQQPGCGVGHYWSAAAAWAAGSTERHSAVVAVLEEPKQSDTRQIKIQKPLNSRHLGLSSSYKIFCHFFKSNLHTLLAPNHHWTYKNVLQLQFFHESEIQWHPWQPYTPVQLVSHKGTCELSVVPESFHLSEDFHWRFPCFGLHLHPCLLQGTKETCQK